MFIIVIVAFSAFALANEPRITPVEKSSSLVARACGSGKSSGATSTTSSGVASSTISLILSIAAYFYLV
ncbi:unnamed protein product [Rhizophagus irregularis]|nr:unnamed protein product [Rhizophagus irregularis]